MRKHKYTININYNISSIHVLLFFAPIKEMTVREWEAWWHYDETLGIQRQACINYALNAMCWSFRTQVLDYINYFQRPFIFFKSLELLLLKAENGQRGCPISAPRSRLALGSSSLCGQEGHLPRCWVGAWDRLQFTVTLTLRTTGGRHVVGALPRSTLTAPGWCPGFPSIRLHSQSPRLQGRGEEIGGRAPRHKLSKPISAQILRMDTSSPPASLLPLTSLACPRFPSGPGTVLPPRTKHRVWRTARVLSKWWIMSVFILPILTTQSALGLR